MIWKKNTKISKNVKDWRDLGYQNIGWHNTKIVTKNPHERWDLVYLVNNCTQSSIGASPYARGCTVASRGKMNKEEVECILPTISMDSCQK